MLKIPLNSQIVSKHKSISIPVNIQFRSKDARDKNRYLECMFVTQSDNKLIYTTCTGHYALQNWEEVNFNLPQPLTINLSSVPYELKNKHTILEIPNCTMETINTFLDNARPKYIRTVDLKNKIIAFDDKRANIEFIHPDRFIEQFDKIINKAKQNPIHDYTQYDWYTHDDKNRIEYYDISKVYKAVFGQNVFEYEYLRYPGNTTILRRIDELHKAATTHGTIKRIVDNETEQNTLHVPVAIFENARQTVIWQGIGKHIK